MVSPPQKDGIDISSESSRTRAAASESPSLPAAVEFMALGGFGDVQGTGLVSEYLSQRTGIAGTTGWATHTITPRQDPLTLYASAKGMEPGYDAEMSDDLTKGVFRAWSPLANTGTANTAHVENLYVRDDLRRAGGGLYRLLTDAPFPIPARDPADPLLQARKPWVDAATPDFQHVLFEADLDLTPDAVGNYTKLYKTDGTTTRLIAPGPNCPGGPPTGTSGGNSEVVQGPCAVAGTGATPTNYVPRVLSADGRRVELSSPVTFGDGSPSFASAGAVSKVFQFDDHGTTATADDALVQLNTPEQATPPTTTQRATYQTASVDGSRVFFTDREQLTDRDGGGLYMWERQGSDETQSLAVDATGGTFALTFHSQPSSGLGRPGNGTNIVDRLAGSFSDGQTIDTDPSSGMNPGTRIVSVNSDETLTLSQPALGGGRQILRASIEATTAPLAFDATAAQVQAALEALQGIGSGNVSVTGGPGNTGATTPYVVTFTGALAGVNVAELTADPTGLTGGGRTATITTTHPLHNLTLIATTSVSDTNGVIGASEDGHRVYFIARGNQLVQDPGAPAVSDSGLYLWQDATGPPGGTLSFIGDMFVNDVRPNINTAAISTSNISRVTPDGRFLVFEASVGSGFRPRYDHGSCTGGDATGSGIGACSEVYLYDADASSPIDPDVVCVSCAPGPGPATANAFINVRVGASASGPTAHLSHALSDDGRRVFFWTAEALVPGDTNGRADVYEYDVASGSARLISSGKDPLDSYFLDASADGHDVYFTTRQQLVGWDTDTAYDVYDARVGGGFPEPVVSPAECSGDACQGQYGSVSVFGTPGSISLSSPGNLRAAVTKKTSKPLSKSQELRKALRACKSKRKKGQRKKCEAGARKRFGKSGGSK